MANKIKRTGKALESLPIKRTGKELKPVETPEQQECIRVNMDKGMSMVDATNQCAMAGGTRKGRALEPLK